MPAATPGKWSKPLRFFAENRGFAELLRMAPGTVMPPHRHTGEVHVFHLSGSRELCTGEIVDPGGYVYEPPGNTDWWRVVGDEPLVALVVVMGEVEFLGPDQEVLSRATSSTLQREYLRHCEEQHLEVLDLLDD